MLLTERDEPSRLEDLGFMEGKEPVPPVEIIPPMGPFCWAYIWRWCASMRLLNCSGLIKKEQKCIA